MSRKPPDQLAEKLCGKDGEGKKKREDQLLAREGNGAEHGSSEIDEKKLYKKDKKHDGKERAVLFDTRKEAESIAPTVEAVDDGGEDEEGEKRGEETDIPLGRAEMRGHIR